MDRREVQRKLVASETFCFAGTRDFPKVYETLTRHHVEPVAPFPIHSQTFQQTAEGQDAYRVTLDLETGDISVAALNQR